MRMSKRPALSKAEMEVARIVWRLGKGTVREVFEAMPPDRAVELKTVQTFLRRLEAKGYLRSTRLGRSKVYRPRIRPQKAIREAVNDLIRQLFEGDALPLLHHLVHDHGLSDDEIQQLRQMLEQLEAQQHDTPE